MINDTNNPNGKYTMLTDDDMILREDEYYDYTEDRWCKVDINHVGDLYKGPYGYYHFIVIRRKNPHYEPKTEPWI